MHFIHASEIVGYYHPNALTANRWCTFYHNACRKLHMNPEGKDQLDKRLLKDEISFGKDQDIIELE